MGKIFSPSLNILTILKQSGGKNCSKHGTKAGQGRADQLQHERIIRDTQIIDEHTSKKYVVFGAM
jgi:hypothetical protein